MSDTEGQRPRKLRLVTNEELQRILAQRDNSSGFVTMLHPIDLYIPREMLEQLTRRSLDALRSGAEPEMTPEQARGFNAGIQQRIDFLSWLQGQDDEVYMSIYPADMDGLDDLEDLLKDDDLNNTDDPPPIDLPF